MNKEITFEQVKDFIDFALRNHQYTIRLTSYHVEIFNEKQDASYQIYCFHKNDTPYLGLAYRTFNDNFFGSTNEVGSYSFKITELEEKEWEIYRIKCKERNNKICANNFNLKFFN